MLPPSVKIYLAVGPTDMRYGIDSLTGLVRRRGEVDVFSGHLFVFISRRRNRAKILFWDQGGFVLYYKRLEAGRFRLPRLRPGAQTLRLSSTQLAMLLSGVDLSRVRKPRHWMPPAAQQPVVQADETTLRIQRKGGCKKGYVWTFLSEGMIGYRFSDSRSGDTPKSVLGATSGVLLVDAYTGYNSVTTPDQRERAGCLDHVRRKYFDSLKSAPEEARHAMDLILEVYRVEHEASEAGKARSADHLAARRGRSRETMAKLFTWCEGEQPKHLPKGPLGKAISYTLNNRAALSVFLDNIDVPVDNNASERALRVTALGRKNFLFVGHVQAGRNLAVLYTLVANCELHNVNPLAYLTEVLIRVQDTPQSRIDELLPWQWKPPDDGDG